MSATVPGAPKTSYVRCLGLKGLASSTLVSAYERRFSDAEDAVQPRHSESSGNDHHQYDQRNPQPPQNPENRKSPSPVPYPAPSHPLKRQVHIGRDMPWGGTPNAVASQAGRAAVTVNERRLDERDPILTSKPCWRPPYRGVSQRDMDRSAYHLRERTVSSPASNLRITSRESRRVRILGRCGSMSASAPAPREEAPTRGGGHRSGTHASPKEGVA